MKQIRRSVFETNSSSTHTLTICTKEEYERFKQGELLFNRYDQKLIAPEDVTPEIKFAIRDYENYNGELQRYAREFTTPSGDDMVAFGFYGYDG